MINAYFEKKQLEHYILEDLQDRILLYLPTFVEHLFDFFTETKSNKAIINTIYLLQKIRQATLSEKCYKTEKCSMASMPLIELRDISFKGYYEKDLIEVNSTAFFSCKAEIYDPYKILRAYNASNHSEILIKSKYDSFAHTPFFPEVLYFLFSFKRFF